MAEPLPVHPLTVDDYHAMLEAGILTEDDRVELIDGQIIEKMSIGPEHIRIVNTLNELAVRRASDVVEVSVQNPVRLGRYSETEPDVALLKRGRDVSQVPLVEDVLLLVEVADATVGLDRHVKLPRYAAAGIAEFWIVNIPDQRLECYRDPAASGYETVIVLEKSDAVGAMFVPELGRIELGSLFGA